MYYTCWTVFETCWYIIFPFQQFFRINGTSLLCLSDNQPRAPYDFYHPYDFFPVRPSEAHIGILHRCCSRGHIRLRAPYGLTCLYTYGLVNWFAGLHGFPMRCPYGHCMGLPRESSISSYPTGPVRGPCGTSKGAVRHSYGCWELIQPEFTKIPHGRRIWRYGPLTVPARSV